MLPLQLFHIFLHEPQLIVGRDVPLDPIRRYSDRQIRGLRLKLAFRGAELNVDLASCLLEQPLAFAFGGGPIRASSAAISCAPRSLSRSSSPGKALSLRSISSSWLAAVARSSAASDELLPYLVAPVAEIAGDR